MAKKLTEIVRPSDLRTDRAFVGSGFGVSELETIAYNIVIISKQNGNQWSPFTWEEYCSRSSHRINDAEFGYLQQMAERGFLHLDTDGRFAVTDSFLIAIGEYVKKPRKRVKK